MSFSRVVLAFGWQRFRARITKHLWGFFFFFAGTTEPLLAAEVLCRSAHNHSEKRRKKDRNTAAVWGCEWKEHPGSTGRSTAGQPRFRNGAPFYRSWNAAKSTRLLSAIPCLSRFRRCSVQTVQILLSALPPCPEQSGKKTNRLRGKLIRAKPASCSRSASTPGHVNTLSKTTTRKH